MPSLNQQITHTEVNTATGEISRVITDEYKGYVESEPDYIKVYIGTQLCINNLDPSLAGPVIAFAKYMTYANDSKYKHMIQTTSIVKEGVAHDLNLSIKRVDQLVTELKEANIFIPIVTETEKDGVVTRKTRRGVYFVNPWVIGKGSWKDIKKLQQNIDFVNGTSSCVIEENGETQELKVTMALPKKRKDEMPGQISMFDEEKNE